MKNYPLKYVIAGSLFTIIIGSVLHFIFEWSGYSLLVAPFTSVNESTWEHIKLGLWPILIWALIEYFYLKVRSENFLFAKSASVVIFIILIPSFFYIYTALLGTHYLYLDILIFITSILISKYLGYKILNNVKDFKLEHIGIIIILLMIFSLVYFTYFPLENTLFQDPNSKDYGIIISR